MKGRSNTLELYKTYFKVDVDILDPEFQNSLLVLKHRMTFENL